MKLNELKQQVDALMEKSCSGSEEVVIAIDRRSFGGIACVKLKSIKLGDNWNIGKCIIKPEEGVVRKHGEFN